MSNLISSLTRLKAAVLNQSETPTMNGISAATDSLFCFLGGNLARFLQIDFVPHNAQGDVIGQDLFQLLHPVFHLRKARMDLWANLARDGKSDKSVDLKKNLIWSWLKILIWRFHNTKVSWLLSISNNHKKFSRGLLCGRSLHQWCRRQGWRLYCRGNRWGLRHETALVRQCPAKKKMTF